MSETLRKASHGACLSVQEPPRVPVSSSSGGQKAVELTSGLLRRCREVCGCRLAGAVQRLHLGNTLLGKHLVP